MKDVPVKAVLLIWAVCLSASGERNAVSGHRNGHFVTKKCSKPSEKFSSIMSRSVLLSRAQVGQGQLQAIVQRIRKAIVEARKSVIDDILTRNYALVISGMGNFLAASFRALYALSIDVSILNFNLATIPIGWKIQFLANVLYGYGYSSGYVLQLRLPELSCGLADFNRTLNKYQFLNESSGDWRVLKFYTTEMNREIRKSLYCLFQFKGTNANVKRLFALVDWFTFLQQAELQNLQSTHLIP